MLNLIIMLELQIEKCNCMKFSAFVKCCSPTSCALHLDVFPVYWEISWHKVWNLLFLFAFVDIYVPLEHSILCLESSTTKAYIQVFLKFMQFFSTMVLHPGIHYSPGKYDYTSNKMFIAWVCILCFWIMAIPPWFRSESPIRPLRHWTS